MLESVYRVDEEKPFFNYAWLLQRMCVYYGYLELAHYVKKIKCVKRSSQYDSIFTRLCTVIRFQDDVENYPEIIDAVSDDHGGHPFLNKEGQSCPLIHFPGIFESDSSTVKTQSRSEDESLEENLLPESTISLHSYSECSIDLVTVDEMRCAVARTILLQHPTGLHSLTQPYPG
jgi:hypothetical protein